MLTHGLWSTSIGLVTLLAVVATVLPGVVPAPVGAAPAPTVTTTSKELVADLPAVEPLYVGYKGTQSFIPKAVAAQKDKRGCNLRQRMIIDLAVKKPKVRKGCKMKGGVWTTAYGSRVTKPAQLLLAPVMSYKDAWDQGAFAWTPAQRLAWATNTKVPGATTRAKGVTNLQVTQALVSKPENARIRLLEKEIFANRD